MAPSIENKDIPKGTAGLVIKLLLVAVSTLSSVVVYVYSQNTKLSGKLNDCNVNCSQQNKDILEAERARTYEAKRVADSTFSSDQKVIQTLYKERIEAIDKQNAVIKKAAK